ncbi:MAG: hypothetical protein QOD50_2265, partial [Actinomycetota bacterium]|nr:hypothetical protein [Actinomycetota bacterium]
QDKYPYPASGTYGPGGFPMQGPEQSRVSELSTDPRELAAQLQGWPDLADERGPKRLWDLTELLLLEYPNTAPDLRAALFQVAAGIDGITRSDDARDPVGRTAVALQFTSQSDDATWTMYFDPGTYQLMAWAYQHDRNPRAWQIMESGIVESAGTLPEGNQWLFAPIPANQPPS